MMGLWNVDGLAFLGETGVAIGITSSDKIPVVYLHEVQPRRFNYELVHRVVPEVLLLITPHYRSGSGRVIA